MHVEITSRDHCPFVGELVRRARAALDALGTTVSTRTRILIAGHAQACPALLIDGNPVCSCYPKQEVSPCPLCKAVPDIPDTEVIRWHLAKAAGRKTVLFICSGNAVRSQMAEAIINHTLGERWSAFSGGIMPIQLWQPVIQVLQEIGIDASAGKAKHIELFLGCRFDAVISLCSDADDFCTAFPGDGTRTHLPFEDPMTSSFFGIGDIARARKLRDDMRKSLCNYFGGTL